MRPLSGAEIWAETGVNVGLARTRSDLRGAFYLCNLPRETVLHISKPGYVPVTRAIDPAQSSSFDVELQRLTPQAGDRMTVEGYFTRGIGAPAAFGVAGVPVTIIAGTVFEGDWSAGHSIKIAVEGTFNSSGVLEASRIRVPRVNQTGSRRSSTRSMRQRASS